jgi:hypothetical protein
MPSKKEVEIQNTGTSMLVISRRGRGKRFLSTIFQTASGVTSAEYVQQAGCLSAVRRAAELFISNASGLYYLQFQKSGWFCAYCVIEPPHSDDVITFKGFKSSIAKRETDVTILAVQEMEREKREGGAFQEDAIEAKFPRLRNNTKSEE